MKVFVFMLGMLQASCSATKNSGSSVKIVSGSNVDVSESPEYRAFVHIKFSMVSGCTGAHIGNGVVLTAAHCFIAAGGTPGILIEDPTGQVDLTLETRDYETNVPNSTDFTEMTAGGEKIKVPLPDLMVLKIKDESARKEIAALPKADVSFSEVDQANNSFYIAGYGLTSYEPTVNLGGRLKSGKARIKEKTESQYIVSWEKDGEFAGAAPGDSGGPLFMEDGSKKVTLIGIASFIKRQKDAEGKTFQVEASYTRLDQAIAKDWLALFIN